MAVEPRLDLRERLALCDLFRVLGPDALTLVADWKTRDLAAHLVMREHDLIAGPCMVLPGPFERFAERRRARLAQSEEFNSLVAQIRTGPPFGFFRVGWVRSLANLNEFYVHHEDTRRANGCESRALPADLENALWRNVRISSRYLTRRLHGIGLDLEWPNVSGLVSGRPGEPRAILAGAPGELLLYLFGRQAAADVTVYGTPDAVDAVQGAHLGM